MSKETNPLGRVGPCRGQVEYAGVKGGRDPAGEITGRVTARRRARHLAGNDTPTRPETLAVEEPPEIRVNGTPITVTVRTPGSDVEFAQRFLLTKGLIAHRDDVLTPRRFGFPARTTHRRCGRGSALDMHRMIRSIVVIDVTPAAPLTSPIYDNGTAEEVIVRRWLAYYGDP